MNSGSLLGVLLRPFEDESLYSLLCRLWVAIGMPQPYPFLEFLFGKSARKEIDTNFPSRINVLVEKFAVDFPGGADELIERHTAFPYISRFLSTAIRAEVRGSLTGELPSRYTTRNLMTKGALINGRQSFCQNCVANDLVVAGQSGFRRVHQMPGVFVCPWHGDILRESDAATGQGILFIPCPNVPDFGREVVRKFDATTAIEVSTATLWLLTHPGTISEIDILRSRLRALLLERGWMDDKGRTNDLFENEFSSRFISKTRSHLVMGGRSRTLSNIALGHTINQGLLPLSFLIILNLLEIAPRDFFRGATL